MLEHIIILILLNTTLIHCAKKWGFLDMYNTYRRKWMPSADCYLCISFWITVAEVIAMAYTAPYMGLILVPFCVASGTNWLVNQAILKDYLS